ncbi:unnamed protein product [Durusdinium trenchii]|uniref:Mitochondrial fission process protein 1 n=1 Tax=Durusdinium trenchii TaxID=1381693 RepID=A0ABP0PTL1_9DINO
MSMDAPKALSLSKLPYTCPLEHIRVDTLRKARPCPWLCLKPMQPCVCQDLELVFPRYNLKADAVITDFEGWRSLPYLARMKRLLVSSTRYIAYSSDVGESLRPVLRLWQVNFTYGIAGLYVLGETVMAGYKQRVAAACAHSFLFQMLASLALPAVIIHTVVHQVQHALERPRLVSYPKLMRYGPSCIGLGLVPFMPLLDPPCEWVVDYLFEWWYPDRKA